MEAVKVDNKIRYHIYTQCRTKHIDLLYIFEYITKVHCKALYSKQKYRTENLLQNYIYI